MILIPAGEFTMGEAHDAHSLFLPDFYMAKYPVTHRLYRLFLDDTEYSLPPDWSNQPYLELVADHPVVNVTWFDAVAYCRWLSDTTDQQYRLPTEAEWEKAARGTEGRIYPWGNQFDKERCNTWEAGIGRTTPVDNFPTGASPYGVTDMVGNVWEWCSSIYADYPYQPDDGREESAPDAWRVLRGGSWLDAEWGVRSARRLSGQPDYASYNTGFRVVRAG